ncbi:hypothetical protein [Thiohalomonas denitrificans]|uniref:Uncharacterized protein n=1 Tax=Thiohalomonas denitrificans TaxID=415747 RepID=A0A1G5PTF4_9GAMM|nr:hypothetical protein [Thiohalomonas denitrificans]SCZ52854.1 hypothetical protein SAMN03097708_00819 [Thiohalomonas denitrificans]
MKMVLMLVGGCVLLAGLLIFMRYMALKRAAKEQEEAARALPEDEVQCFSCGLVVPREKALEKKGRYFCGVKRNDRDGNPIQRASGDGSGS